MDDGNRDARREHEDRLGAWRTTGGDVGDLATLAAMPGALPSVKAALALVMHERLLRNMTNVGLNEMRGQEAVHAAWASWTGLVLHNFPYIAAGQADRAADDFLLRECDRFVRYAGREPVPAEWHPDHPASGRGLGVRWRDLCDLVAGAAQLPPAYGVPAVSRIVEVPPPPAPPALGLAERFLPAPLRAFLRDYAAYARALPVGSHPSSRWRRWEPEDGSGRD